MNSPHRRYKPKAGDIVVWDDDSIGILIERYDIYNAAEKGGTPSWSWIIEFPSGAPDNYNMTWGEGEYNLMNRNKIKKIISC